MVYMYSANLAGKMVLNAIQGWFCLYYMKRKNIICGCVLRKYIKQWIKH